MLAIAVMITGLPLSPAAAAVGTPTPSQSEVAGEFADNARELLANPIGREGVLAHKRLNMWDSNRNLAIFWYDLTGFQRTHVESFKDNFEETPKKWADWTGEISMLKRDGHEALFDKLGIVGDGPVLAVTGVNDPKVEHSEIVIPRVLSLIAGVLGLRNDAQEKLLAKLVGIYSDRDRCGPCLKATIQIPEERFASAARYGTEQQRKESANQVKGTMSQAESQLRRESKEKQQQAKTAMPVSGSPATHCSSMRGGTGRAVTAMSLKLAADPCAEEDGSAQPGALDQALASSDATYGGVDFSTLEMRYISDGSDGVQYAYSAQSLPEEYQQDNSLGVRVVKNLGDDLRTWLVLDPQKFWVNLNPTEPDRIVDPALGQTNAGKAMLEADLEMKRTEAKILHPDSATGAKYWQQLQPGADGTLCFSSRMWIVPGQVEVREDSGSLYILKALLDVKTKSDHIDDPYSQTCKADPATDAHNEELERTLVLPEVVKAVNTAPEYAPLRRAFMARIIAQWTRERHQQGHRTAFDRIIDSQDLGPARLDGDWRPKQVFDDYVRSYRDHEFDITRESTDGGVRRVIRYVYGGADLTNVQLTGVTETDLWHRYPQVARAAQDSATRQVTAQDGSIWLGGAVQVPEQGFWDRLKDDVTGLTGGNGLLLAVLLLALGGVLFGFRSHRGNRGNRTGPTG
ncbi:hypothetical protein OG689_39090 [Kitasatospora sp. NBC_00240]|uniref:hypothetical protein n=1 Tax=Kitasatospora sp. NBC_00240 TaxID=2903567 RepID=UPI002252C426|nr:hypothetical protein [Kitasatospora sp. NBC_00240]MCX5215201.1 hypothetical protein [Kitasatospora sp. NBC_00240]